MDPNKLRPELIEAICIDDFTLRREFGRERGNLQPNTMHCATLFAKCTLFIPGLNPTPTNAQKEALDKLNHQLQVKLKTSKSKKDVKEETETEIQFDLKSRTRVILWRGNLLKKRKCT